MFKVLGWKQKTCRVPHQVICLYTMVNSLMILRGTVSYRNVYISEHFHFSWYSFSPIGLVFPPLVWGFCLLIAFHLVMLGLSLVRCSILKWERFGLGTKIVDGSGMIGRRETMVRMYYIKEESICNKTKFKVIFYFNFAFQAQFSLLTFFPSPLISLLNHTPSNTPTE